jgi:hypothetical protein
MSQKHHHTMHVTMAGTDVPVEFTFTCSPVIPEQGPSYSSGGQPAEGGEVEILSALVLIKHGTPVKTEKYEAPDWLHYILCDDEDVIEALREAAQEDEVDAREYAAEMRAEMRREEAA